MSSLEQRLKTLPSDPGLTDPDFDVCIVARQSMTQPCAFRHRYFFYQLVKDDTPRSCWGGHILRAAGAKGSPGLDGGTSNYTGEHMRTMYRITKKLGFHDGALYNFNDTHSHAEVIAEFDRRLQLWGE